MRRRSSFSPFVSVAIVLQWRSSLRSHLSLIIVNVVVAINSSRLPKSTNRKMNRKEDASLTSSIKNYVATNENTRRISTEKVKC
mmetsp:Transcript_827/g.1897  ORF Transcript_827/g.1897 Transcript_827/m.1897 type:complete len:84 (+) Transcript_827:473-724(+)